jgi:phosphate-selective porin
MAVHSSPIEPIRQQQQQQQQCELTNDINLAEQTAAHVTNEPVATAVHAEQRLERQTSDVERRAMVEPSVDLERRAQ